MKHFSVIFLILMALNSGSCERIEYAPDNPFAGLPTRVLMHRGSGDNTDIIPNTLQAAEYGLSVMDGIELDIQISKDGTLWLDHDNEVHDCSGNVVGCFQTLTDTQIKLYEECDGVVRYHTVESVFQLMAADYPDSYISLDVKGQYCEIVNTVELMHQMADEVLALVDKYKMHGKVLVESNSLEFMEVMDNQSSVGQCIISLGDVDEGLANAAATKARGISLKYGVEEVNSDVVALIHNKGYGLVLWTINEYDDIIDAWNSRPDFIETDNSDFKDIINSMN
jgi:glycerophosphoryl diester phosphodiesterase